MNRYPVWNFVSIVAPVAIGCGLAVWLGSTLSYERGRNDTLTKSLAAADKREEELIRRNAQLERLCGKVTP